jgi:uracil-DNA glycosylase
MLGQPHVKPLVEYLEAIRLEQLGLELPCFDPCDGGICARALFLLEAPGPKAVGSAFISRNNPDQTAKNMGELLQVAGIARGDTLIWNIVPWYVGDGSRIRAVNSQDIEHALPYLRGLLNLLPNLKVIVLVGKKAQSATAGIRQLTSLPIMGTYHPSPRVFNVWPEKKEQTQAVFVQVASLLRTAV